MNWKWDRTKSYFLIFNNFTYNQTVDEAAQSSIEISSSTIEQLQAIENIVTKVEELKSITNNLNEPSGQFKM